ncbi:nitrate/nitrite two-component system sensor histidine kinase NarQ [Actinobacillus arthritidis]|uniref:nitrate/nitrite two-component system sensor histidine kinase NarQ n=1 Tax=Actinobacillus arthritidis TaxID=157339 RepID=UPI0024426302|nr:nitrate/nitrite two-component system sensor histidine kinase NarQ [Actinobacillus arthritidis]WGE90219.1 nitrate/nitrite two-component system sensor histidine kinase NarQ [Actinobacillus arthritidis]
MIAFASLISGLSLGIMWSNKSDAGLINVSGSLRMQSYRFLYEMEHHPQAIPKRLEEYRQSLNSPEIQESLSHNCLLPAKVKKGYENLKDSWQEMESFIVSGNRATYVSNIEGYANQVNNFVWSLQEFVELKLKVAIGVIAASMFLIIALAYFGVWYTRKRIITPLNQLVTASEQVKNEDFNHIELAVNEPNELGFLSSTFTQMASELAKLYASLEEKVEDKTRRLIAVNRSLLVLFQCSQLLTAKPVNQNVLFQVLQTILDNEQLRGIEIQVYGADYWNVTIDNAPTQDWRFNEIAIENEKIALLRWKPSLLCPDERLIQNVSEMIGRSLYVLQVQKQQQQLVLMEERSIIARELHDSLAQSLTFFKIQISLLKRNGETKQDWDKQKAILNDFERALNEAYSQLRELLSTFRLTIEEANLTHALERVLDSLRARTSAQIILHCKLPSQIFSAQQQVHALQIVREAVINAIKHANATQIEVIAETNSDGEQCLIVRDNGKGLESEIEPEGHYGLTIMKERATELNGEFSIKNRPEGGTEVMVILPNMITA